MRRAKPSYVARPEPTWLRALLTLDRGARAFAGFEVMLRDEMVGAWLDRVARGRVMERAYDQTVSYSPRGALHRRGLFAWERLLLKTPPFPTTGRLLLGGAGGGRELAALVALGYEVVAFEPSGLFDGLRETAAALPGATAYRASYADLVAAAERREGPLADLADLAFDGVVLGWDSFSHLLDEAEQLTLLRSLRCLAPSAPVIASVLVRSERPPPAREQRTRDALRRLFRALGAPSQADPRLRFIPPGTFAYLFTRADLERLAASTGYRLAFYDSSPNGHALLVPTLIARLVK